MPADRTGLLACAIGALTCCVFYGSFKLVIAVARAAVWVARRRDDALEEPTTGDGFTQRDPVDAQLDTNPVEPLLTHGVRDEEESNETAADFVLWANELDGDPGIRKYSRRMDRWSR